MKKNSILVMILALLVAAVATAGETADFSDITEGVVDITVSSKGLKFNLDEIRVKQGVTVRLTYENGGGGHDWVLDEFGAATDQISGGESETVEFVVDRAGTFEFYCSVGRHRQMGMKGAFVVVG